MTTLNLTLTFVAQTCCVAGCGIPFALESSFDRDRRNDHEGFYCPRGHSQFYTAESDEARLKREKAELEARLERERRFASEHAERLARRAVSAEHSARAFKGQATRIRRRAHAGVCVECNRTFQNVARHMATCHPEPAAAGK